DAGAQLLVHQQTHHVAVSFGELAGDGEREIRVAPEDIADRFGGNGEDTRRGHGAQLLDGRGAAQDGGEVERADRLLDVDGGALPVVAAVELDRAFGEHV